MRAHGVLHEFDPLKESIEDFCEHFDISCLVNNICGEEEAVHQKQALFLSQAAFTKLKTLASPTPVSELMLDQIMEHLIGHHKLQIIEIAERFKFFKWQANPLLTSWQDFDNWQILAISGSIWRQQFVTNLFVGCVIQRHNMSYFVFLI